MLYILRLFLQEAGLFGEFDGGFGGRVIQRVVEISG